MIRKLIGWGVATGFALLGVRARALKRYSSPGTVLSLFGHDPKPEVLDALLRWLTRHGFTFVSTDEVLAMRAGAKPWQLRTAWLTFDDGWAGFEAQLLPILEKYHAHATIFVAPGETARGQIWTNSILSAVSAETIDRLYMLPVAERYAEVDAVLAKIGNPRRLAPEEELRRLATHPLITLENHTYSHLSCGNRPTEEVLAEVEKTQQLLTDWTGRVPKLCCYPFGHYTDATDAGLRAMGLIPVHSNPGVMTVNALGDCRNMFHETMGVTENVGRVLGAWKKVHVRTW